MKNIHYKQYRELLESSNYSPSWKNRLLNYFDIYIEPIPYSKFIDYLNKPEEFADYLAKKKHVKIPIMKAMMSVMLYIIRKVDKLYTPERFDNWTNFSYIIYDIYDEYIRKKRGKLLNDLSESGITLDYLKEYRKKLEKDDVLRLILDLYVLLPPARSDYGSIRLLYDKEEVKDDIPNYILFNTDCKGGELYIKEHKTAGIYKNIHHVLPTDIIDDLQPLLCSDDKRKYLFEKAKDIPYNKKRFDEFVIKQLRRIHPSLTINSLRKLYASTTANSFTEMKESADDLKHRLKTHIDSYVSFDKSKLFNMLTCSDSE